jgi:TolA-binding protein
MIDNRTLTQGLKAKRDSLSRTAAQRIEQQEAKLRQLIIQIERLRSELAFHDWLP